MEQFKQLPDEIREYLRSHPETQMPLSKQLGVSQSWLSRFLAGTIKAPRVDRLFTLAEWVEKDRTSHLEKDSN